MTPATVTLLRTVEAIAALLFAAGLIAFRYYPVLVGCGWTLNVGARSLTDDARLLFVADPQLEGNAKRQRLGPVVGALDEWFNDFYFRHVAQTAIRMFQPTHVVLLGDLLSTQNLDDAEFDERVRRLKSSFQPTSPARVIYLVGNHDVGYGIDLTAERLDRFERAFGSVEEELEVAGHLLVKINNLNLDGATDQYLYNRSLSFIRQMAKRRRESELPVILLQHIPMHKPHGFCADGPEWRRDAERRVVWQDMLSEHTSHMILAGLQPRFVFSGHDHEGCYTAHEYSGSDGDSFRTFSGLTENGWRFHAPTTARQHAFTMKAVAATGITNKLEPRRPIITNDITVRSTMAEFGGNLGMFEVRRNGDAFDYAYSSCPFVNHIALWVLLVAFSICTGIIVVLRANAMINFLKEHMQSGVEARKVLQPQLFTGLRTPVMDKIQSPLPSPARSKSPMPLRRRRSVHRH